MPPGVSLLEADPQLARGLAAAENAPARAHAFVSTRSLPRGRWDAIAEYGTCSGWLGLLVLEGFVARETLCGEDAALEVIGPGDLLRPWDHDGEYPMPMIQTRWEALQPARLALLDEHFVQRVAPWPAITAEILARTGRRARWLASSLTVAQHPRIDARVAWLFRQLAARWGEPQSEGTLLRLRLTHEQIAKLVGAHRPSVTAALGVLRARGSLLRPATGTWLISARAGEGPGAG
jgi:CRP-like cAMP-binding protein